MHFRLATSVAVLCALLAALAPATAFGGGGAEDYARAKQLAANAKGKVRNVQLREVWLDAETMVYRRMDPGGTWRLVRVDATTGKQGDAFDHAKVAARLSELMQADLDPARLDVQAVGVEEGELQVQVGARVFGVATDTGRVRELSIEDLPAMRLPPSGADRSVGGGRDTSILFVNQAKQSIDLLWLGHDGRERGYGQVAPNQRQRQHTFPGHVWRVRAKDGRSLGTYTARRTPGVVVVTGKRARSPREQASERHRPSDSPDGRLRLVLRDHNVFVKNRKTGKEQQLSHDGTAEDAYGRRWVWSPSGRYVMVVQTQPAQKHTVHVVNSVPGDKFQPTLIPYAYLKPGDRIAKPRPRLFDVKRGKPIELPDTLFSTPWSIGWFSWSSDGKRFRFLYNQRGHQVLRFIELDAARKTARAIIEEQSETFVDYSQKTFIRALDGGKHWLWMSERSGWNHVVRVEAKSGKATPLTEGPWVVRRVLEVDEDAQFMRFEAMGVFPEQDPYHVHVGRVGLDGTGLTWLTKGDGTHTVRYAPDGRHYVDSWSRVDLAPVHELRRTGDGGLVCELERADLAPLRKTGWRPTERFHAKGRDGKTDIWGVLHLPSNLDPKQRYPVIEAIYAGPHGHFVPKAFRAWSGAKALAELGFIVVQIDGMGTNWRSRAFHDVCWKNLGDSGFPDRIAWMRAAAKTRPYMDLDRVGIYGGSAGGQSALRALLAYGDFYDAAAADCGCHDNRMDKIWWNEAWMGWPIGPHYDEQSNITQAHRLTGKLLLMVGEIDRNVDPASTMKVVDALIKADKDFDLIVFPGKGHGAGGSAYGRRRQADFFVRHLMGVEPRGK